MNNTVDLAQFLADGCLLFAAEGKNDFSLRVAKMMADGCYVLLALNFLWGLYFVIMSFMRVRKLGFRSPKQQGEFMDQLMTLLSAGQYDAALEIRGAIVANGGADDDHAVEDGGWRGHEIVAAIPNANAEGSG